MIRLSRWTVLGWLAGAACTLAAQPVSDWARHLAAALARPAAYQLNSANLPEVLSGVLDIVVTEGKPCQPNVSLALEPATHFILAGEIVGFPDRARCPKAVPLSILNIGLQARSAEDVQEVKHALLAALPQACFDGILPNDKRRRAPPSHMAAWSNPYRLLTFVWDEYDPTTFTLTYVRRDLTLPEIGEQKVYAGVRDALFHPIPTACLDPIKK